MGSSESPLLHFSGDDQEMEQAKLKARQTFRFFWREMAWEKRRIIPGLSVALIKATFSDPPEIQAENPDGLEAEQMWLRDVEFDGRRIRGALINTPHSLQTFNEGDLCSLSGKQLTDWLYVVDDQPYGGFTVDVIRSRMEKRERKEHDEMWGFDFGEVGRVDLVPRSFLEETPEKKGLLSRLGGSKSPPQDSATVAAVEHPMSVAMSESLEEMLADNPDALHEVDERGFSFLHELSLAGAYHCVNVCLKHGADPNKPTKNGMTPFALAKVFNWKRVMARLQKAGATQ